MSVKMESSHCGAGARCYSAAKSHHQRFANWIIERASREPTIDTCSFLLRARVWPEFSQFLKFSIIKFIVFSIENTIKVRLMNSWQSEKLLCPNSSIAFKFFVYETDQKLGPELLNVSFWKVLWFYSNFSE